MTREASTAASVLHAVSLAITLVSIVTFATMAYSAYQDTAGMLSTLGTAGSSAPGAHLIVSGNMAKLNLGFSVPNNGLYPLAVRISCAPSGSLPVSCGTVAVSVGPGLSESVNLALTVTDLARLRSILANGNSLHLNATAAVSLEPFATLSLTFDLGPTLSGAAR